MNVRKDKNGTMTMSQPTIMNIILISLGIWDESKMYGTPENVIQTKYEEGNGRKKEWSYLSVIGKMNYLSGTTRPDNIFAVHQCAN